MRGRSDSFFSGLAHSPHRLSMLLTMLVLPAQLTAAVDADFSDDGACAAGEPSPACQEVQVEQSEEQLVTSMRSELLQRDLSHRGSRGSVTAAEQQQQHQQQQRQQQQQQQQHRAKSAAAAPGDILTFYAYRTVSDKSYPPENVNMGNLEGVMWYLHHEIVPNCPRKFQKTRIQRFKITYKTTPEMVRQGKNFGWRYAFDSGACSDFSWGCVRRDFKKNGYIIGCNDFEDPWGYPGNHPMERSRYGKNMTIGYTRGIWYSFPGPCPDRKYWLTDAVCRKYTPGGRCDYPTGANDCTYSIEPKGEVVLDEVVGGGVRGIDKRWCRSCKEYDWGSDKGTCTSFWNEFWDHENGQARLRTMFKAFQDKYPEEPELPDPVCDFDNPQQGYFIY